MALSETTRARMLDRLRFLYGERAGETLRGLEGIVAAHPGLGPRRQAALWAERDAVLITYGDQVREEGAPPLESLRRFLLEHRLGELLTTVHILPFFPYSSDDGFSVIDYRRVDDRLGTWDDIARFGDAFALMFDLVLNHASRRSEWFQGYLEGRPPYDGYFIEIDPAAVPEEHLRMVTRPRSSPLLTPVETSRGTRHVWTTFSDDQIDLDYANPRVLLEMLDILLLYAERGARIIRLDAIAYLWKRLGTPCIHLPETHTVVKLMRDLLDDVAPGTILLTETNVPHRENVGYFGDGDEAHMVYNFSLAPLLLDALLEGDATYLDAWLADFGETPPGTSVLNFTASHDGVGLRPLEGLVPPERLARLIEAVRARGGMVSTRLTPEGTESPYELNITYFSALGEPAGLDPETQARRFLTSQAVMLALRGIPGLYFHSLVATPNDLDGVRRTGRTRSINRRKFARREIEEILARTGGCPRRVFDGYRRLLEIRRRQPAFHPEAPQAALDAGAPGLVAFLRTARDGGRRVIVAANVTARPVTLDLARLADPPPVEDLLGEVAVEAGRATIPPYGTAWFA